MRKLIQLTCLNLILVSLAFSAAGPLAFESLAKNYTAVEDHYSWQSYQRGDFLIIGADAVMLNPYIDIFRVFKERQGFRVTLASLTETGNTATDIRAYIADYYATHNLEYVLLIGDVEDAFALPSFTYGPENDVTDLPYVLIEGGADDYYPEAFIGRWPVDTQGELVKIITRTIAYTETPDIESGYLERALVTAGNYADSGTILTPVWTSLWLRNEMDEFGYAQVDTVFFPPETTSEEILSSWNAGVGIVNYRGWGDANGWHFPHFHVSDFDDGALTNSNKLPIVFSFVCGTGKFDHPTTDPSFCEALLTQGSIDYPTGAVAVVAPSDLHTRTKFNNALNSKLWDALLEGHVNELAPALLASKFGFQDEFVNELGPGEMAEFYYHTYNVIGDPSLPIWLLNPTLIDIEVADFGAVKWSDGLISLEREDLPEGVFALRQNDELVGSGRWTDGQIHIYRFDGQSFYDADNPTAPLEVTLNAAGHLPLTLEIIPTDGNGLTFVGMDEDIYVGLDNWTPQIHNHSGSSVNLAVTVSTPDGAYSQAAGDITIPAGQTQSANTILAPGIQLGEREMLVEIQLGSVTLPLAIPIQGVAPDIEVEFVNSPRPLPENAFSLALSGSFVGMNVGGPQVNVTMTSPSEFVTLDDQVGAAYIGVDGELVFSDDVFSGDLGLVSHGSRIPLSFEFRLGDQEEPFYIKEYIAIVGAVSSFDPTPPVRGDGYWAYDNTDSEYPEVPTYDWLDLSTQSGAQHHSLNDDDHVIVDLPFSFTYYDLEYSELTINSNGWAAFGADYINYFRNWSIPMPLGPDAMMAPFWDDLDNDTLVNGQEEGRPIDVYSYHDQTENRFIVEWHEVWNGFGDRSYLETFQIVLHDPASFVAEDGNGIIEFQYETVHDVDQINNYSTVGIESPDQNDGLMYVYALNYAPGAAELEAGRCIRFTTNPPEFYVEPEPVGVNTQIPTSFKVGAAYPNPFNGVTTIPFSLKAKGDIDLEVYDLLGRKLASEKITGLTSGSHRYQLNTTSLNSGVYLIRIEVAGEHHIQKVTLLK